MTLMKKWNNPGLNPRHALVSVYLHLGEGCARIVGEDFGYTLEQVDRQLAQWRKQKWTKDWHQRQQAAWAS